MRCQRRRIYGVLLSNACRLLYDVPATVLSNDRSLPCGRVTTARRATRAAEGGSSRLGGGTTGKIARHSQMVGGWKGLVLLVGTCVLSCNPSRGLNKDRDGVADYGAIRDVAWHDATCSGPALGTGRQEAARSNLSLSLSLSPASAASFRTSVIAFTTSFGWPHYAVMGATIAASPALMLPRAWRDWPATAR